MVDQDKQPAMDEEALRGKSTRDKAFRATWIYLRGCLVIVALYLLAKAAQEGYSRVEGWLVRHPLKVGPGICENSHNP